jgi:hypothetical protein
LVILVERVLELIFFRRRISPPKHLLKSAVRAGNEETPLGAPLIIALDPRESLRFGRSRSLEDLIVRISVGSARADLDGIARRERPKPKNWSR